MSTSPWSVVKPGDESAQHTGATRNVNAERGQGRAWRHEPDMTPIVPAHINKRSNRTWGQSNAVEKKTDLSGRTKNQTVLVKSGNNDSRAIGLTKSNVGVAGFGDAAPAVVSSQRNLYLIGGLAALAAAFLLFRK